MTDNHTSLLEKIAAAPPMAVAGATFFGYTMTDWAALVTILYTLFLFYLRLRREYRRWKEKHKDTDFGDLA